MKNSQALIGLGGVYEPRLVKDSAKKSLNNVENFAPVP